MEPAVKIILLFFYVFYVFIELVQLLVYPFKVRFHCRDECAKTAPDFCALSGRDYEVDVFKLSQAVSDLVCRAGHQF